SNLTWLDGELDRNVEQLDAIPLSLHSGLMAFETIEGTLRQTRLTNESHEYRERREELRLAEIDLMQRRERVAELRRRLPPGATVQDYVFQEGAADLNAGDLPTRNVRLSELFSGPDRSVVVYHFMYGKKQTNPCP